MKPHTLATYLCAVCAIAILAPLALGEFSGPAVPLPPVAQQQTATARPSPGRSSIIFQNSLPVMRDDARLHDVAFVNPQAGWAVGDRGVIWSTLDGGAKWTPQSSGVDCTLQSISIVDQQTAFVAGGGYDPYSKMSSAVLLWTRDGGKSWRREQSVQLLPFARRVKFFDRDHGWLLTDSSAMYPSGLFVTEDAGRTWTPVLAAGGWRTADFLDMANGAVAGFHGDMATLRRRNVRLAAPLSQGLREVHDLRLVPGGGGWLAGDGGLVMLTGTGGNDWQFPEARIDDRLARLFDFSALCVHGPQAWIAGAPGSMIFHTPDAGRSWQALPTGQSLPIRGIHFTDQQHGWAVGDLGVILATADGGRTWQTQHRGGTRVAALGILTAMEHAPWEAISQLSAQEGYLTAAHVLSRRDLDAGPEALRESFHRFHDAVVRSGGSSGDVDWQFPAGQIGVVRESRHVQDIWDQANDGLGLTAMQERLVRLIRTWRPEVIITADANNSDDPAAPLAAQMIKQAVVMAADEKRYADHIQAGLRPWKVTKVVGVTAAGIRGQINIETAGFAPRLQGSLAEHASASYAVSDSLSMLPAAPDNWGFNIAVDETNSEATQRGLLGGIVLQPGGDARRMMSEIAESTHDLKLAARKFRNVKAILDNAEKSPQLQSRLMGQIGDLTSELDAPLAGRVLFNLAASYHRKGKWPLAAQTFEALVKRHPDHPLTPAAGIWLVQYYSSAEASHWTQRREASGVVQGATTLAIDPTKPPGAVINTAEAMQGLGSPIRVVDYQEEQGNAAQAIAVGHMLEELQPQLSAEPRLLFSLAAAYVNQGLPKDSERLLFSMERNPANESWRECAAAERWVATRNGPPVKPLARCGGAAEKPHLDGVLNDRVWQTAASLKLRASDQPEEEFGAEALIASDGEYVYLAVRCRKHPRTTYEADDNPRPRDATLDDHDRVEFLIDIDRDYATYYRLAVDHRGWTSESCFGDESWNPLWHVASGGDADHWTAEIAVPLKELAPRIVPGATVWALGVQRVIPGVGLESWTQPASTIIQPQGFGLLSFPE